MTTLQSEIIAEDVRHSEDPDTKFNLIELPFNEIEKVTEEKILFLLSKRDLEKIVSTLKIPRKGSYVHSKSGRLYSLKGVVYDPVSSQLFVWYQARYYSSAFGDNSQWVRPFSMFEEMVSLPDGNKPRFQYQGQ